MPPKNVEMGQLYYEIRGKLQPIKMVSMGECTEIISDVDSALHPEYLKGSEMSFELTNEGKKQITEFIKPFLITFGEMEKLLKRTFWCNNWRKMHHLPMIRQRGRRK